MQHVVTRIHHTARRPSRSEQEQHFRAAKLFGADGDEVFVWRLVGILIDALCRNVRRCSAVPLWRREQTLSLQQQTATKSCSKSGVSYRRPRIRSLNTAGSMYRVRRRRFAEARSADSTKGGSANGGAGEGVSIIRLMIISILSVSFSMRSPIAAKGVSCSRHESSMPGARAGDINCILDRLFTLAHRSGTAGRRGARIDGNLFRRINDLISSERNWRVHQIGDGTLFLGLRDWHVHNLFGGELLYLLTTIRSSIRSTIGGIS